MAIVALSSQHRSKAEILIKKSDRLLKKIEDRKQGDYDQMVVDLQSVSAMATLAAAHVALAQYFRS